ncbi:MAG TPA: 7,8-didemethyl-8-hydroxy-5-deazariboflavin synthase CofG, partial [Candidatus Bathyarchaeia archaeon]|nr:7,8-didemethyl-8-hydroxy-5-deazariboflavin synthase CofG [Candidatus Bathyarchaeia archaeon]
MVEYLRDMCELVLEKTGLLPHSNPGVLSKREVAELKDVNASMGLMLESASERLCEKGGPHEHSPGKSPKLRLATIKHAGQLRIPFTTGLLMWIGETVEERVDSLFAIKELHQEYGHVQEVIIQNFKAKPGTRMGKSPEPTSLDMRRTVAAARLIFGGETNIQAPPNLSPETYPSFLFAGANDLGGVSPVTRDFVNPEAPWPLIRDLRRRIVGQGFDLRERLPIYPEYVSGKPGFIHRSLKDRISALVDGDGYVKEELCND